MYLIYKYRLVFKLTTQLDQNRVDKHKYKLYIKWKQGLEGTEEMVWSGEI